MNYHKFDVIVTEFPFIDKVRNSKIRPAVIISSDDYNKNTGFVVIAMITSAKHSKLWNDIKLIPHKALELHSSSIIRMKFANITKEAILSKIGKLNKGNEEELSEKLKNIF